MKIDGESNLRVWLDQIERGCLDLLPTKGCDPLDPIVRELFLMNAECRGPLLALECSRRLRDMLDNGGEPWELVTAALDLQEVKFRFHLVDKWHKEETAQKTQKARASKTANIRRAALEAEMKKRGLSKPLSKADDAAMFEWWRTRFALKPATTPNERRAIRTRFTRDLYAV